MRAVKMFLKSCSESDKIKYACKKMMKQVRLIIAACREFLNVRKTRCIQMEKCWQKVEDQYLAAYFEHLTKLNDTPQFESKVEKPTKGKRSTIPEVNYFYVGDDGSIFDWRVIRIPELERQSVIKRYYSTQLWRHVLAKKNLSMTLENTIREQMEFKKHFDRASSPATPRWRRWRTAGRARPSSPAPPS